tara:strand:- start:143 stop:343 length:201 start_codon:yes stop_codon:yes gene_type:complete
MPKATKQHRLIACQVLAISPERVPHTFGRTTEPKCHSALMKPHQTNRLFIFNACTYGQLAHTDEAT